MGKAALSAIYVALAALLWGADSMIRVPGLAGVHPTALTFYEHLVGLLFLVPFITRPSRRELGVLRPRHLLPLFWVGIAGEALAGILFADSYRAVGGGAAGFLQMLQPFCVLAMVWALGRERAVASYLQWAMFVLFGALVIWVFDPAFDSAVLDAPAFWAGTGKGFTAVALWAAGTVAAKILLETFSPSTLVFLRWSLSLVGLAILLWLDHVPVDFRPFLDPRTCLAILAHTLVFALLPLWIFYRGLRLLPASLATFLELACPLALVFLPWILGAKPMQQAQWLGGISMVVGVVLLLRLELEFLRRKAR